MVEMSYRRSRDKYELQIDGARRERDLAPLTPTDLKKIFEAADLANKNGKVLAEPTHYDDGQGIRYSVQVDGSMASITRITTRKIPFELVAGPFSPEQRKALLESALHRQTEGKPTEKVGRAELLALNSIRGARSFDGTIHSDSNARLLQRFDELVAHAQSSDFGFVRHSVQRNGAGYVCVIKGDKEFGERLFGCQEQRQRSPFQGSYELHLRFTKSGKPIDPITNKIVDGRSSVDSLFFTFGNREVQDCYVKNDQGEWQPTTRSVIGEFGDDLGAHSRRDPQSLAIAVARLLELELNRDYVLRLEVGGILAQKAADEREAALEGVQLPSLPRHTDLPSE